MVIPSNLLLSPSKRNNMKVCTKILAPFVISMIPLASYGQVSTQHVGSFNWRGGITNIGQGEFLYGTLTIGSNGKIASSYFVP